MKWPLMIRHYKDGYTNGMGRRTGRLFSFRKAVAPATPHGIASKCDTKRLQYNDDTTELNLAKYHISLKLMARRFICVCKTILCRKKVIYLRHGTPARIQRKSMRKEHACVLSLRPEAQWTKSLVQTSKAELEHCECNMKPLEM